jgi:pimeloyl-ACP methyl ester carboxylesterase
MRQPPTHVAPLVRWSRSWDIFAKLDKSSAIGGATSKMTTHTHADSHLSTPHGVAQPFYFESGEGHLFGWLHRPSNPRKSDVGVVICSPYGYESICAHRSVREFAEAITAIGIPALRFDYRSTGDSSEIDENADHVTLWSQDVVAAIHEMRARTGVERICLLGIRLGALLASLAAAECRTVESLILIGPVVNGRRFVRELRTTQLAGLAMAATASAPDADSPAALTKPKTLEAGGFSFSEATLQSLGRVDLLTTAVPTVRSILVIDNDKLLSAKRWVESLSNSGIEVDYRALPGLIEMVLTAPQFAAVPVAMIDAARDWVSSMAERVDADRAAAAPPANRRTTLDESSASPMLLAGDEHSPEAFVAERPVLISTEVTLFGIVTEPRSDEKRRRAVILLNAAADFHIGASRMYVSLARRWARRGYFVLRLDFAGIGDSATRPGKADDEVFPEEALDDIRSAIEFMRSRYDIADMTLTGLCSGAYHALRAAAAGLRVNRILMVNPQNYFWKKGMTLEQVQLVEVAYNPGLYRQRLLSLQAWTRIFKGQVNVWRIGVIYLQRILLEGEAVVRNLARLTHIHLPNDLGRDLEKIVSNRVRITFLFARGEPGIELLRLQAGSTVSRLGELCRVRLVESGDHIFSQRKPRSMMEDILSEELFAGGGERAPILKAQSPPALQRVSAK